MDIDDDDDFYAPEEPELAQPSAASAAPATAAPASAPPPEPHHDEDLEEGEEEDEGAEMDEDDSDIDIITERKDGTKAPPPAQSKYSDIRNIPQRTTSSDASRPAAVIKKDDASRSISGADLPAVATSTIDVHAIPIHKGTGKPITQVNIDDDLPENDKPWRKPGTDLSDYFNYGFDEFTWALYAAKQESVRGEYSQDAIAQNNKKMMEDMQMMMMGGMAPSAASMPGMPGMDGMPPEMQQMMQQMMSSGMDPSQMDPTAMFAAMQNAGGGGGQGGQNQNFGGGGQGFGGGQGQGYGYDQGMGRGGGGGGFGRGRGGRRNW